MHFSKTRFERKMMIFVLLSAAAIRLASLGAYPLTDNTEARYAEVAREMVATDDWITPQLYGEKFWSKPPLSIWITAWGMKVFGINEFAARLSHLIISLITVYLVYCLSIRKGSRDQAWGSIAVLITSLLFFISSGAVMTDAVLTLGTTLSMVAFWRVVADSDSPRSIWGYLFFLGQVIGLLAKGPVALVLTFFPVCIWILWKQAWHEVRTKVPWVRGLLAMTMLTLPWYVAAEMKTPGFLRYFIIGEHWARFTQPGWAGDMYGSAHSQPMGTIWLFWVIAAFPWSIFILRDGLRFVLKHRRPIPMIREADGWAVYLILWAFFPMVFFTLAGNILWTYVLPGLPAFALLAAGSLAPRFRTGTDRGASDRHRILVGSILGLAVPIIFGVLIFLWAFVPVKNSQKYLARRYQNLRPSAACRLIYLHERPYSAAFYTSGKAIKAPDLKSAEYYLTDNVQDFFAIRHDQMLSLPAQFRKNLVPIGIYDDFILLSEDPAVRLVSKS